MLFFLLLSSLFSLYYFNTVGLQKRKTTLDTSREAGGLGILHHLAEVSHLDTGELQEYDCLWDQRKHDWGVQDTIFNGEMRQLWTIQTNTGYIRLG